MGADTWSRPSLAAVADHCGRPDLKGSRGAAPQRSIRKQRPEKVQEPAQ